MQLNDEPLSYYDVLELTTDATPQEIRSAYLRLKASYNKDNVAHYSVYSREETDQMIQKIEEAYLILSNPERRKSFDSSHQITTSNEPSVPATVIPAIEMPVTPTNAYASGTAASFTDPFFAQHEGDSLISAEQEWNGSAIRKVRESKRISIEDLADFTRISKTYLIAIEEENYQKLPAIVYVRGFLQQISKRLKLPADLVIKKYVDRLRSSRPDKF